MATRLHVVERTNDEDAVTLLHCDEEVRRLADEHTTAKHPIQRYRRGTERTKDEQYAAWKARHRQDHQEQIGNAAGRDRQDGPLLYFTSTLAAQELERAPGKHCDRSGAGEREQGRRSPELSCRGASEATRLNGEPHQEHEQRRRRLQHQRFWSVDEERHRIRGGLGEQHSKRTTLGCGM